VNQPVPSSALTHRALSRGCDDLVNSAQSRAASKTRTLRCTVGARRRPLGAGSGAKANARDAIAFEMHLSMRPFTFSRSCWKARKAVGPASLSGEGHVCRAQAQPAVDDLFNGSGSAFVGILLIPANVEKLNGSTHAGWPLSWKFA
jgi:hypothetical protein